MRMENQEEILLLLERFTKAKQKDIPRELEDYLTFVARTGDTVYRWVLVKPLFREKLVNVITDFHDNTPSIADLPPCPNVDPFNYERMKRALLDRLDSFNSAPFTVQRICELLTEPRKQYTRIDKFMRAVEKNILVVSTQEPGRRRSDSENDSLDSIVNGDMEVNVDIEMDNEQFHLEADALLPDSSDPVGVLHADPPTADSPAPAERADSELNGRGSFMNDKHPFERSGEGPGGTSTTTVDHSPAPGTTAVVDTNENATDGDIAKPLLESARADAGSPTIEKEPTEQSDDAGNQPHESKHAASPVAAADESSDLAPNKPTENSAPETGTPATTATTPSTTTKNTSPEPTTANVEEPIETSQTPPTEPTAVAAETVDSKTQSQQPLTGKLHAAAESDKVEEQQADDGEPLAKMVKYDVGGAGDATELVNSNTTSSDSTDSTGGSGGDTRSSESSSPSSSSSPSVEERLATAEAAPPSAVVEEVKPTVVKESHNDQQRAAVEEVIPKAIAATEVSSVDVAPVPVPAAIEEGQQAAALEDAQHSKSDEVIGESVEATEKPEPTSVTVQTPADQPLMESSATPAETVAAALPLVAEQEMELAVSASIASTVVVAPESVMEEDMPGAADEELLEEGTKADDNVMDIDESSVEPMDQ
ncbi:serine/threonine-protein phosphatase 4 regulatory subunit 2 [Anopheles cruzii]|uniref:serine/threonine-protein phosphatase 4 regulatory subunit 2 n=1 Tax=Anopheles cruzii TaxID=68878 RepID=UPI0022EC47CA|nr:serine/threonine-protein phosphatase 4 regulatory subunit 2 [Anopheles cruzii]